MDKAIHQNNRIFYLLKGLLLSYIVTTFFLLILAFLMLKLDLSSAVLSGGTIITYIVSAFLGGFYVGKRVEQKKFLWGLVVGVLYFIVFLLVSLLMNQAAPISIGGISIVLVICSVSGMLGGMLS